jgi:hypothetical protein
MKFVRHLLGWSLVLGSVAGVLWGSFALREHFAPAEHEEAAKAEGEHDQEEHEGLHLDEEAQKRLGLVVVELKEALWQTQAVAYGEVLSTLPVRDLESEIVAAESTVAMSKRGFDRAKNLKAGGNMAEKDFDAAEMQSHESEMKLASLKRRLAAEWGEVTKTPLTAATVLVRVELPASQVPKGELHVARLLIADIECDAKAASLVAAALLDQKTQRPAWIIRFEASEKAPAVGAAVTATLACEGDSAKGVLVPADAIVHFNGLAWVFVEAKPGEYERRLITLDRPLTGGWFAEGEFEAGDHVVTTGAVNLLAVENKSLLGEQE